MERVRQSLMSKVESLLLKVSESSDPATHVVIEAYIHHDQRGDSQRLVLDTIGIDELRQSPRPLTSETPSGLPTPSQSSPDCRAGSSESDRSPTRATSTVREANSVAPSSLRSNARRKEVGGLRLGHAEDTVINTPPRTPTLTVRQLETDERQFPKRRKLDGPAKLEQSTVDKLIEGIWEQIHKPRNLALGKDLGEVFNTVNERLTKGIAGTRQRIDFEDASRCCQQITSGSRTNRALEVIVQAHWVDCYDARLTALREDRPDLKTHEVKKTVLVEACKHFHWSEKELRNRMGIWKGYREIKDAAGWVALVFAGPGIYRFCKYRMGFDQEALAKLQAMKTRAEVAADTLQPQWRELLSLVGAPTQLHWRGHPHDWAVSKRKDPVPLALTYKHIDAPFTFKHLVDSIVDDEKWGDDDPRRVSTGPYVCETCSGRQSLLPEENDCECFPDLFGPAPRTAAPVQVFRTDMGKNNGLLACCTFERGQAVGEFVGLITCGLNGVDVMQGQAGQNPPYQIWQGRCGNFTRFINHSCQPNCQFTTFTWLGVQRIIVVAKGVPAGKELTVDYSSRYWNGLDKECLCGEARCRYKSRPKGVASSNTR